MPGREPLPIETKHSGTGFLEITVESPPVADSRASPSLSLVGSAKSSAGASRPRDAENGKPSTGTFYSSLDAFKSIPPLHRLSVQA